MEEMVSNRKAGQREDCLKFNDMSKEKLEAQESELDQKHDLGFYLQKGLGYHNMVFFFFLTEMTISLLKIVSRILASHFIPSS